MTDILSIYDWHSENIEEEDSQEPSEFKIFIFGKNIDNQSVCLVINKFTPYFYLKVPKYWKKKCEKKCLGNCCECFLKKIKKKYLKKVDFTYDIEKKRIFKGFYNDKKFRFIRVIFNNTYDMRRFINIFEKKSFHLEITLKSLEKIRGYTSDKNYLKSNFLEIYNTKKGKEEVIDGENILNIFLIRKKTEPVYTLSHLGFNKSDTIELFESNIDPLLRFLHIQDLEPCCKVKISKKFLLKNPIYSYCQKEYYLGWEDVNIVKNDKNISPLKVLAFDLECNSSHGDFPLAIKDWSKSVKEIIKLSRKKKITTDILTKIFNFIPSQNYENISKVYLKNLDYFENIDKTQTIKKTVRYLYLNNILLKAFNSKKNIIITTKNITEDLLLDLSSDYFNEMKELIKIYENTYFKKISYETNNENNKYSIEYSDSKNPLNYTEQFLIDLFNNDFKYRNKSIIEGDQIIQIGSCLINQGEKECYLKDMLTLESCEQFDKSVRIKSFETKKYKVSIQAEKNLILSWRNLILTEDPDMITGFNIFNFDIPYIFERAQELEIYNIFADISRIKDKICLIKEKGGKLNSKFVDIPGRIQFDIYKVIKDGYNLDSYKLDNVSSHFIRGSIIKIKHIEGQMVISVDNKDGLRPGNFIKFIWKKGYEEVKLDDGKKIEIDKIIDNNLFLKEKIEIENIDETYWCLGKDDISAKQIFEYQRRNGKLRAEIAKYCIMDVVLCVELMNKLKIVPNNMAMSNVCTTPLSWIFTRGQGIKILSLVSKECRKRNFILPTLYPDTYDNSGYEGACVLDAKSGIYWDPIVTLDYASLYPNSMIAENLSHETHVISKEYLGDEGGKKIKELGYSYNDIEYDNYKYVKDKKVLIGKSTERFIDYGKERKGILPTILKHLLQQRKITRNKIKHKTIKLTDNTTYSGKILEKTEQFVTIQDDDDQTINIETDKISKIIDRYNDFEKENLDGFQLGYKVTANSLYGQLGARTSPIYYKQIAASTTATGRKQLYIAKDYIEKNYKNSEVIYGDTDSVFVNFGLEKTGDQTKDIQNAINIGKEAGENISKILKKPQDLEYEKTFYPFLLVSKKKYVGNKYEENPKKYKQTSMGIVLKRRDNAPILKLVYGNIIDSILSKKDIQPAINYLRTELRRVIEGKFNLDLFIITKTLNDNYKNPDMIAHNVLAERIAKRTGKKPQIYDRIGYIYIKVKDNNCLQGERIETKDFIINNKLTPDYYFYITNQIMKPVSQIFSLVVEDLKGFNYGKNYYQKMTKSLEQKNLTKEKIIDKIKDDRQKKAENILFYDIQQYYQNQQNNVSSITKWFPSK